MLAGRKVSEAVLPFDSHWRPGLEVPFADFEYFARRAAALLDEIDDVFDPCAGWPGAAQHYGKTQCLADRNRLCRERQLRLDADRVVMTEQFERALITAFEERAARVFDELIGERRFAERTPGCLEHEVGMVFDDVVQVVRNAAAYVFARIGTELLENRQNRRRVFDEPLQCNAPRQ